MPIVYAAGKRIFFAHIPKTGGSSLEIYLVDRFGGPLALRWREGEKKRGIISPSHHLSADDLKDVLERDIDAFFAIVRNPLKRTLSQYMFQSGHGNSIPSRFSFSTWLRIMKRCVELDPRVYRNHIRSQGEMIPEGSEIFKMEDGFAPVLAWLDEITGTTSDAEVGHHLKSVRKPVKLYRSDVELIHKLYADDYEAFGYPQEDLSDYPEDRFAALRAPIGWLLGTLVVFRQRQKWLR
ncbi:MAG: sulfotransferase family 2 domain-containing protein [Aliishimia sp.]